MKEINLLHFAYYLLQLELAGISFGISSLLRKGSVGIGIIIAYLKYTKKGYTLNLMHILEYRKLLPCSTKMYHKGVLILWTKN